MHTALGSLEIEDLLVGQRCPRNRFLASSHAGRSNRACHDGEVAGAGQAVLDGFARKSKQASAGPALSGHGAWQNAQPGCTQQQ